MAELDKGLTVINKDGSTHFVTLYDTPSVGPFSLNDGLYECKVDGQTAYYLAGTSGSMAYQRCTPTDLTLYRNGGTSPYYVCENYQRSSETLTPFTGSIYIPAQTIYTNSSSTSDYINYDTETHVWLSDAIYVSSDTRITIQAIGDAFGLREGVTLKSDGTSSLDYSHYVAYITVGVQSYSGGTELFSGEVKTAGDGNEGGWFFTSITSATTVMLNTTGYCTVSVYVKNMGLRARAQATIANDIEIRFVS